MCSSWSCDGTAVLRATAEDSVVTNREVSRQPCLGGPPGDGSLRGALLTSDAPTSNLPNGMIQRLARCGSNDRDVGAGSAHASEFNAPSVARADFRAAQSELPLGVVSNHSTQNPGADTRLFRKGLARRQPHRQLAMLGDGRLHPPRSAQAQSQCRTAMCCTPERSSLQARSNHRSLNLDPS